MFCEITLSGNVKLKNEINFKTIHDIALLYIFNNKKIHKV